MVLEEVDVQYLEEKRKGSTILPAKPGEQPPYTIYAETIRKSAMLGISSNELPNVKFSGGPRRNWETVFPGQKPKTPVGTAGLMRLKRDQQRR